MSSKDSIIKKNLEFVYGRSKGEDVKLHDPDKVAYLRTKNTNKPPPGIKASDDTFHDLKSELVLSAFEGDVDALHPAFPCVVYIADCGEPFPSFEHALQASKFLPGTEQRTAIKGLKDVIEVKRYVSKQIKLIPPENLTPNWQEKCTSIAVKLLRDKFMRSKSIKFKLIKTGHKELVFANNYQDMFWGCNASGLGQNNLGKSLEVVRREIEQGRDVDMWIASSLELIPAKKTRFSVMTKDSNSKDKIFEFLKEIDEKNIIYVGKGEFNDVLVDHPTVSRAHAAIAVTVHGGVERLAIIDLGSSNGTFTNGSRLEPFSSRLLSTSECTVSFGSDGRDFSFSVNTSADILREKELLARLSEAADKERASIESENTVFVRNLAHEVTDSDVHQFFAACGTITALTVPRDRSTGLAKGIAFVSFSAFSGVIQALSRDGDELKGRYVKVKKSDAAAAKSTSSTQQQQQQQQRRDSGGSSRDTRERDSKPSTSTFRNEQSIPSHYQPQQGRREDSNTSDSRSNQRDARSEGVSSQYNSHERTQRGERHGERRRDSRSTDRNNEKRRRVDSREREREIGRDRNGGGSYSRGGGGGGGRHSDDEGGKRDGKNRPKANYDRRSPSPSPSRNTASLSPPRKRRSSSSSSSR